MGADGAAAVTATAVVACCLLLLLIGCTLWVRRLDGRQRSLEPTCSCEQDAAASGSGLAEPLVTDRADEQLGRA